MDFNSKFMERLFIGQKSRSARSIWLTMRLTASILLISALHLSATGLSQKITFSGTNVPLSAVFNAIEEQTGYGVVMSHEIIEESKLVTVSFTDATLDDVMKKCLAFLDIEYGFIITGHTISIRKERYTFVTEPIKSMPPSGFLGVVRSMDGKFLSGATVEIIRLNKKSLTDEKGEFYFEKIPNGKYKVEITFIGYEKYQTYIDIENNQVRLAVDLRISSSSLDQVQVIAYGTTTQRLNTGNVKTISGENIQEQPVNNPLLALEGRVPGLFITQSSGLPGAGVAVTIQGKNSINSGNDPFYIVDGVPFSSQLLPNLGGGILGNSGGNNSQSGNPLTYINPSDIESISVLKDADATAIYGSRAANGAIIITTKKGKVGQTLYDMDLQSGLSKVSRNLPMLNTKEYLQMRHEAINNDGGRTQSTDYDINGFWDTTQYTNWQKELMGRNAAYTNLTARASGGTNATQFSLSGTYHKESIVFPGNYSDQKGALHFSLTNLSNNQKFKIQFSANYLIDDNRLPNKDLTIDAITLAPNAPHLYNEDGSLNWMPTSSGSSTWTNPFSYLSNRYNNKTDNFVANTVLSYQILKNFEIQSSFGYNSLRSNEIQTIPLISTAPENRPFTRRSAFYSNSSNNNWIIEPQLRYKIQLLNAKFDVLLGGTINQKNSNGQQLYGSGYNSDLVLESIQSASSVIPIGTVKSVYKYNALFSRVNLNWYDRYLINVTFRRDGSSRFGSQNRFHNFAATGIGWIFSKEDFFLNTFPLLSFGKVRGSYGTTGNDQISDYRFLSLYNPTSVGVPYLGANGLLPDGLSNPYLQWEETKKLQIGLELGFFNDKILFNVNYFNNRSSNQLLPYTLPIITGFANIFKNFPATVLNAGWEISLSTVNFKSNVLTWTTSINITIPENKLLSFPNLATSSYAAGLVVGQPSTIIKVFQFEGVNSATGEYQFSDGKGGITSNPESNYLDTKKSLINTLPKYYGALETNVIYKHFDLDVLVQFVKQIGPNYLFGTIFPGRAFVNEPSYVLNRWQKSGDIASIQKYNSNYSLVGQYLDALNSSAAYSDASYIRIKNISLSWHLPEAWTKKAHFSAAKIYINTQNLITISDFKGLDPESMSSTSLPPLRVISFGIKAVF